SGLATVAAAQRAGAQVHTYRELVQAAGKNSTARRFVDARNDLLVDATTLVLDIVDPAALVLAGEVFVIDRVGLRNVVNKVRARRAASQLRISLASPAATRDAARLTGVYPLRAEPLLV
ncbi:MAG: ROK family protein, partial [Corynebacterium casei]|nr:ROK family protein [Corynebacterium casei]